MDLVDYRPTNAADWKRFLEGSNNGTLFHDLDFLAYHCPGRFRFQHLLFFSQGELVALLPGGVTEDDDGHRVYHSPCGASVGGPVLPRKANACSTHQVIARLKDHARDQNWSGIEFRIGPSVYLHDEDDQLSFCLAAAGFQLRQRWLTHIVRLPPRSVHPQTLLPKRKREYIRSAQRKGAVVCEVDFNRLGEFYDVLLANRAKHGAKPTHSLEELWSLAQLVPDAIRLFLCSLGTEVIGGSLVFELNSRVAYNFYPCHNDTHPDLRPALLVALCVIEHYTEREFRYLDLGPTTFDDYSINEGLASFKEGLGARGYCRDTWKWRAG